MTETHSIASVGTCGDVVPVGFGNMVDVNFIECNGRVFEFQRHKKLATMCVCDADDSRHCCFKAAPLHPRTLGCYTIQMLYYYYYYYYYYVCINRLMNAEN